MTKRIFGASLGPVCEDGCVLFGGTVLDDEAASDATILLYDCLDQHCIEVWGR